MSTETSLRQLALKAGVKEEIDTADIEVFAHGTSASFGSKLIETQGGCLSSTGGNFDGSFHTVANVDVASTFADRTCSKRTDEKPMVVGVAISRGLAISLRSRELLSSPPIPHPPRGISSTTPQHVFHRGALSQLAHAGFFFKIK
jgi:hypothetical protein